TATQTARAISSTVISLGDTGRQSTVSGHGSRASTAGANGSVTRQTQVLGPEGGAFPGKTRRAGRGTEGPAGWAAGGPGLRRTGVGSLGWFQCSTQSAGARQPLAEH